MEIVDKPNLNAEQLVQLKSHVYDIIGCCQEVHRELGPWLNEYVYQEALKVSLEEKRFPFMGIRCHISTIWIFCAKVTWQSNVKPLHL